MTGKCLEDCAGCATQNSRGYFHVYEEPKSGSRIEPKKETDKK